MNHKYALIRDYISLDPTDFTPDVRPVGKRLVIQKGHSVRNVDIFYENGEYNSAYEYADKFKRIEQRLNSFVKQTQNAFSRPPRLSKKPATELEFGGIVDLYELKDRISRAGISRSIAQAAYKQQLTLETLSNVEAK